MRQSHRLAFASTVVIIYQGYFRVLKNVKRILAYVIILRGSFLFMYFKFGVRSFVVIVVMVMIGNLVLTSCSKVFAGRS